MNRIQASETAQVVYGGTRMTLSGATKRRYGHGVAWQSTGPRQGNRQELLESLVGGESLADSRIYLDSTAWAYYLAKVRSVRPIRSARARLLGFDPQVLSPASGTRQRLGNTGVNDNPPAPEQTEWEECLSRVDEAIRRAYDLSHARESLHAVAAIWERLDQSSGLAEARSRILLGKVQGPTLAPAPAWLDDQIRELKVADAEEATVRPEAIESAAKLVRACLAAIPGDHRARVAAGINGRVEVDWEVPAGRLQWMVDAAELPWPGVKALVLSRREAGSGAGRKTRVFRHAFALIENLREHVRP